MKRWPGVDPEAVLISNRKQAVIPDGATVLDPIGTAPGLVVARRGRRLARRWSCCPVRRANFSRCGRRRWRPTRSAPRSPARPTYRSEMVRLFGIPESEIAATLRAAEAEGLDLSRSRSRPVCAAARSRSRPALSPRPRGLRRAGGVRSARATPDTLFSWTGARSTSRSPGCWRAGTIAVAESCTGGRLAARLTDRAGSSAYFMGGVVVYSNEAKIDLAGVAPALIERHGAVSAEVAEALADGAPAPAGRARAWASPASPAPVAAPRTSRSAWSTSLSAIARGRRPARRSTRAARRPQRRARPLGDGGHAHAAPAAAGGARRGLVAAARLPRPVSLRLPGRGCSALRPRVLGPPRPRRRGRT